MIQRTYAFSADLLKCRCQGPAIRVAAGDLNSHVLRISLFADSGKAYSVGEGSVLSLAYQLPNRQCGETEAVEGVIMGSTVTILLPGFLMEDPGTVLVSVCLTKNPERLVLPMIPVQIL